MSFITFAQQEPDPRKVTNDWIVRASAGVRLGSVSWFAAWRRYTFKPDAGGVFDAVCLREIADFCEGATKGRKRERAAERGELRV